MDLVTFAVDAPTGRTDRVGVRQDDQLIDLTAGYAAVLAARGRSRPVAAARALLPPDLLEILRNGPAAMDAAREVAEAAAEVEDWEAPNGATIAYDAADVSLRAPLPRPNTIRDFSVFEDHAGEKPEAWYDLPAYYKGNPDNVVDPGATVEWPAYSDERDYELELAAIVGRECRNVTPDEAEDYIAGYTIFNDFSARDIQAREMQMGLGPGKGKDFANGFGPALVTTDSFDPADAAMSARVNGDTWSEGNTGEMYHSIGDILAHAARDQTVYPGDVLGTGTVGGGCGYDLDRRLSPGDTVTLEIEGLGTLTHTIE